MTYPESIEFLYGLRLFGLKLGLENTRQLAREAGNPQERLQFIHIAGTNGKGSVAAMLESIYRAAGLRVGLYTSPHLVSFRERIQVNREPISEMDVVRLVEASRKPDMEPHRQAVPEPDKAGATHPDARPTFFEFVTVMALRYFDEKRCDLVIWETGLGGRLDATNIVTPLASVITNVESDHQHWLGHDLRSIATEKAGIIKAGIPTITATSEPEALAVIQATALAKDSPLTLVNPAHASHPPLDTIRLPLMGWHQRMNAATALATIQVLRARLPVTDSAIRSGLETVNWPGRLQMFETGDGRQILLDGAHNAAAATSLRAALEEEFAGAGRTLILGILQDKDWALMSEVLAPVADRIICVPVRSERGADPDKLAAACRRTNQNAEVAVMRSVQLALEHTNEAALTVVTGSIYLVGEALAVLSPKSPPTRDEQGLNDWVAAR